MVIQYIRKIIWDDELIDCLAEQMMEVLGKESNTLPLLRQNLAEVEKGIENMINAIQMGIFTASTKQRLEDLELQRKTLSDQIQEEERSQPTITKEQIMFFLLQFRKLDTNKLEHRRQLINSFVNAVILYDDHFTFVGNYKDGIKTVTFAELEAAGLGSGFTASCVPNKQGDTHEGYPLVYFARPAGWTRKGGTSPQTGVKIESWRAIFSPWESP